MKAKVKALGLNIRTEPKISHLNIKRTAKQNEIIEITNTEIFANGTLWVQLKDGSWTAKKYLEIITDLTFKPKPPIFDGFAKDITDGNLYLRDLDTKGFDTKENNLVLKSFLAISKLDVENKASVMQPKNGKTFCNIYAYQYNRLMFSHLKEEEKPYFPRLWWSVQALSLLEKGLPVVIDYGNTVFEMNANAIYDWFLEWGEVYGWTIKSYSKDEIRMSDVQKLVNGGKVAYVIGKHSNPKYSGHFTCVVPEVGNYRYSDELGLVQSQAGATNKRLFTAENYSKIWYNYSFFEGIIVVYA
jgi:hypothetical protein